MRNKVRDGQKKTGPNSPRPTAYGRTIWFYSDRLIHAKSRAKVGGRPLFRVKDKILRLIHEYTRIGGGEQPYFAFVDVNGALLHGPVIGIYAAVFQA